MKHLRDDCTVHHINFGGGCLNCGAMPEPKDARGVPYTVEMVKSAARDHVAYGWTKRPGSCSGEPWTPELLKAYDDEYNRFKKVYKA